MGAGRWRSSVSVGADELQTLQEKIAKVMQQQIGPKYLDKIDKIEIQEQIEQSLRKREAPSLPNSRHCALPLAGGGDRDLPLDVGEMVHACDAHDVQCGHSCTADVVVLPTLDEGRLD